MTDRDRWWMTATVWMEARGESRQGKLAVAYVILNRFRRLIGEDARVGEVCLAPKQFSCWNADSPTRKALARVDELSPSWVDSANAVELALAGAKPDPTGGARHYYNPSVASPAWDKGQTRPRVTIGHHVFVRDVP